MDLLFTWNQNPVLFSIGSFGVRWYGLFFAVAFLLGLSWMQYAYKKEGKPSEGLEPLLYKVIFGVIVGARLGHCLFYDPGFYFSHPIEILKIREGGLGSHGSFVGLFLALWFHARKYRETPFFWLSDQLVVGGCLGAALIRVGNFFNSEIIGIPTSGDYGIIFLQVDTLARHPVQLYEAFAYFLCSVILFILWKKGLAKKPWRLTSLCFMMAAAARFFLESFKTNQTAFDLPVHMGQILSIPFFLCGLFLLVYGKKLVPKNLPEQSPSGKKHNQKKA